MSCFQCGSLINLMMVANRNEKKLMVGWLFCCKDCFPLLSGMNLSIKLLESPK